LLIAVGKRHAAKLVEELHAEGVKDATEVGYATSLQKPWVRLV
jgi:hydrogenase maturation factor